MLKDHAKILSLIKQLTEIDPNARIHIVISQHYYYKLKNENGYMSLKSLEHTYDTPVILSGDTREKVRLEIEI